tara:strand:+ start:8885 stop:9757 length:873 start_codon:yes stop_codon:yes gene_type:complete
MNYLEVSYISSACGKNKYEPTDKTILILLARSNPKLMKRLLIEDEYITIVDENEKLYDNELKNIYSEYKKNVTDVTKIEDIRHEIIGKLKSNNKDIKDSDVSKANKFLESSLKKDCGTNNESSVIKRMRYTKGNNFMHRYNFNDSWEIRGFHDASIDDVVIEIKTRTKFSNIRKNEYDLYQMFGYLLTMNKTKGKIVQKFQNYIFDSDEINDNEFGLIDISQEYWKTKFETFKNELSEFFSYVDYIIGDIENRFNILDAIKEEDIPIAVLRKNSPRNINHNYEKLIKILF